MGRFTRFDHLETERPSASTDSAPRPLERFSDDAPATATAPRPTAEATLQRFSGDGRDVVQTEVGALEALPTLECGACGTECGKFEVACHVCGGRLDSDETRTRNAARLTAFTADQQRAAHALAARRDAELRSHRAAPPEPTRSPWLPVALGFTSLALLGSTVTHLFLPLALAGAAVSALLWRTPRP